MKRTRTARRLELFTTISTPEIPEVVQQCISGGLMSIRELIVIYRDQLVNAALILHQGNQCKAAKALHMHRNTLARAIDSMLERDALKASLRHADYRKRPASVAHEHEIRRIG